MADFRKLEEIKRSYYQTQLSSTSDSLYDLQKKYFNDTLGVSGDIIADLERAYLQTTLSSSIGELSTLWDMYFDSRSVPSGRLPERELYFYRDTGFSVTPAPPAGPTPIYHSKLESDSSITSPTIGSAGTINASAYAVGKFGNGFDATSGNAYKFSVNMTNLMTKGAISVWIKPHYSDGSGVNHYICFAGSDPYMQFMTTNNTFEAGFYDGSWHNASWTIDWAINDLVHIGFTWDKDNHISGTKHLILYKNGVEVGSGTDTWTASGGTVDFFVGSEFAWGQDANMVIDNLKIYDQVVTDFSADISAE